jgi:hypothetical protein
MNIRGLLIPTLLILSFCGSISIGSDKVVRNVETLLDEWKDRGTARQHLFQIGPEAQVALQFVAISDKQSFLRRSRAISLLGTIGNSESIKVLGEISINDRSAFRCRSMQALAEIGTEETLHIFMQKLDDSSVCMQSVQTDPAEKEDILVCDEAIRLLERITGQSLAADKDRKEKIYLWKAWWKNRSTSKKEN